MRAGNRTATTMDSLWRAACAEANAQEFTHIPPLHAAFMKEARQIIEAALRQEQGHD
jgi:hypothetical protein